MRQFVFPRRYFAGADLLIFMLVGALIYGVVAISALWRSDFHPVTAIDLSLHALPLYTLFSAIRALVAFALSLLFTIVVGYAAAKSKKAERFIIPMLDILQSIPPLGFMPGLVLGLIALFPRTNTGLELTAIILIFTGQVWNMTFSFYSSVKSLPTDYTEASTVMGLSWWKKLWQIELPFSAVNLVWNSILSMAGGWFFLSVAEAFTLGDREFRIPGIGSYMAVAIAEGNSQAMVRGVIAMVLLILVLDFCIWHPILSWVRKFRIEDVPGSSHSEALMLLLVRDAKFIRWLKYLKRRRRFRKAHQNQNSTPAHSPIPTAKLPSMDFIENRFSWNFNFLKPKYIEYGIYLACGSLFVLGSAKLIGVLLLVKLATWFKLLESTGYTFLRVIGSLAISSLWAVPAGIWIGLSPKRVRIAQPIIQVLASFPAPMLYPLALTILFKFGFNLNWGSMFLMLLGVQWYVLFNVLAGALRISNELGDTLSLMNCSRADRWKTLYLPSVFPSLVTGWVTAAGGAWNASMVSEYIAYKGKLLTSNGLGATISAAAAAADFPLLAASLTLMVVVILSFNRSVWSRVYHLAQNRYRTDG
jgi:NitT/TauT family transport system permease protein